MRVAEGSDEFCGEDNGGFYTFSQILVFLSVLRTYYLVFMNDCTTSKWLRCHGPRRDRDCASVCWPIARPLVLYDGVDISRNNVFAMHSMLLRTSTETPG
jgi:hypothetical protein